MPTERGRDVRICPPITLLRVPKNAGSPTLPNMVRRCSVLGLRPVVGAMSRRAPSRLRLGTGLTTSQDEIFVAVQTGASGVPDTCARLSCHASTGASPIVTSGCAWEDRCARGPPECSCTTTPTRTAPSTPAPGGSALGAPNRRWSGSSLTTPAEPSRLRSGLELAGAQRSAVNAGLAHL
jgi:hypothetical protein